MARLHPQRRLSALSAIEAFRQPQCSGATPKHTTHNFSVTSQVVDDASQSAGISTDTMMPYTDNRGSSHSPAQCKGVTSVTEANTEASNDWTTLHDIFGESMQLPTQRYFGLTDNDFVKGKKRRCGGPSYTSTMHSFLKQHPPAPPCPAAKPFG